MYNNHSWRPRTPSYTYEFYDSLVKKLEPDIPLCLLYPERAYKQAEYFAAHSKAKVFYAVKCNTNPHILKALHRGGVYGYDCASMTEIKMIRSLFGPTAPIAFMAPVKSRAAIAESYFAHHVRTFSLDSLDEFQKIVSVTKGARDCTLFVRLSLPKADTAIDFSTKFGADPVTAALLMKSIKQHNISSGITFHVGTQCLEPAAYDRAIQVAKQVITRSGVVPDVLDVGGGFPSGGPYALESYFETIQKTLKRENLTHIDLICEPGRALVANVSDLIVRIEGRKDDLLFINDGVYGGLQEAGLQINMVYPATLIPQSAHHASTKNKMKAFRFTGPTCDSLDMMNGPFMLPETAQEGDWIVLQNTGAYAEETRTKFNGFGQAETLIFSEEQETVIPMAA